MYNENESTSKDWTQQKHLKASQEARCGRCGWLCNNEINKVKHRAIWKQTMTQQWWGEWANWTATWHDIPDTMVHWGPVARHRTRTGQAPDKHGSRRTHVCSGGKATRHWQPRTRSAPIWPPLHSASLCHAVVGHSACAAPNPRHSSSGTHFTHIAYSSLSLSIASPRSLSSSSLGGQWVNRSSDGDHLWQLQWATLGTDHFS